MSPIDVTQEHPRTIANGHSETLGALLNEVYLQKAQYSFPPTLIFVHSPIAPTDMYPGGGWSRGPATICHNIAANASTLLYIDYLKNIHKEINKVIARSKDNWQVLDLLDGEMSHLELFHHTQWTKQQSMMPDPWGLRTCNGVPSYNTAPYFSQSLHRQLLIVVGLFLVVVLNLLHHLVREGCRTALHCLKIFMEMSFLEACEGQELPPWLNQLVLDFPVNLDHARKFFKLEPKTKTYACCPSCFSLYLPSETEVIRPASNHNSEPIASTVTGTEWSRQLPYHDMKRGKVPTKTPYPTHCTSKETSNGPECGSALL
ncbi:hypothetical protein BDR06DRAFT_1012875 [Suillus hirtellus]|nr:hypothetical protein BDR06DRAFT_1012875 [Suillus hirtellus]